MLIKLNENEAVTVKLNHSSSEHRITIANFGGEALALREAGIPIENTLKKRNQAQIAISSLRAALSSLPVSLTLTDEIIQHCERELKA